MLMPWLGGGLLVASGDKWFRNRKLLTHGFHFDVLKSHTAIHNSCVEIMMATIEEDIKQNVNRAIEIFKPITSLTLDIIIKCVFSSPKSIQHNDSDNYLGTIEELKTLIVQRWFKPHLYLDFLYCLTADGRKFKHLVQFSHKRSMQIINNRRGTKASTVVEECDRVPDFLDILLTCRDDNGIGLTDTEILDEVETFMFEGHDTTSAGIAWALYNLAKHPEYQKRVQKEIDSFINGRPEPYINYDDLNQLPFLTMCLKESMRVYPPVPFIGRQLTSDLVMDEVTLPAGTFIDICIWNTHHNPEVWGDDHMTFNPQRFSPENIDKIDPYAFIPFSAGPRNCIGQNFAMNEMKIVVGRILYRYDLRVDESCEIRLQPQLILKAENGIMLNFTNRH